MNYSKYFSRNLLAAGIGLITSNCWPQTTKPYRILDTAQTMGTGGIDYVYADSDGRRLYVPRGNQILVFDLDTLKSAGSVTNTHARGVAVDPKSHHGFCSSSPVVMWDTRTLETIKTIPVEGTVAGVVSMKDTQAKLIQNKLGGETHQGSGLFDQCGNVVGLILGTGQSGDTLFFDLGDVPIGGCGSLAIGGTLSCGAVLGQTVCCSVAIRPDSICFLFPGWSGATLRASAECEGDRRSSMTRARS